MTLRILALLAAVGAVLYGVHYLIGIGEERASARFAVMVQEAVAARTVEIKTALAAAESDAETSRREMVDLQAVVDAYESETECFPSEADVEHHRSLLPQP